jgi:hypothetical protein
MDFMFMGASKQKMFEDMEKSCTECGEDLTISERAARHKYQGMCRECYEYHYKRNT